MKKIKLLTLFFILFSGLVTAMDEYNNIPSEKSSSSFDQSSAKKQESIFSKIKNTLQEKASQMRNFIKQKWNSSSTTKQHDQTNLDDQRGASLDINQTNNHSSTFNKPYDTEQDVTSQITWNAPEQTSASSQIDQENEQVQNSENNVAKKNIFNRASDRIQSLAGKGPIAQAQHTIQNLTSNSRGIILQTDIQAVKNALNNLDSKQMQNLLNKILKNNQIEINKNQSSSQNKNLEYQNQLITKNLSRFLRPNEIAIQKMINPQDPSENTAQLRIYNMDHFNFSLLTEKPLDNQIKGFANTIKSRLETITKSNSLEGFSNSELKNKIIEYYVNKLKEQNIPSDSNQMIKNSEMVKVIPQWNEIPESIRNTIARNLGLVAQKAKPAAKVIKKIT